MSASSPIRVGIAGVRGYTGLEAARLFGAHPGFRIVTASSDAMAGSTLSNVVGELGADGDATVVGHNDTVKAARSLDVDLMILGLPAEPSARLAGPLVEAGIRVIDLSGARRLKDLVAHVMAYGFEPEQPELNASAVYGLTEWVEPATLQAAQLVANPGCYPTAVLLSLLPLAKEKLIAPTSLVVDAKSGTTGAGKRATVSLLHAELYGNFYAYRVGQHQHTPEIAQALSLLGGRTLDLTFVTHLLPVARGILTTSTFRVPDMDDALDAAARCQEVLKARYADSRFVRVFDKAEDVSIRSVVGTNRCHVAALGDPFGRRVVVVAAIDNLRKGAAGQALQNANIMFGFDESTGLEPGVGL